MRVTTEITKGQFTVLFLAFLCTLSVFFIGADKPPFTDVVVVRAESIDTVTQEQQRQEKVVALLKQMEIKEPVVETVEVYEEPSFYYYSIPEDYITYGGYFPEAVQDYLWEQCEERGLDYYIAIALIERESGYKHYVVGDNGNSIGYMQIQEKWHKKRMEAEGVTDLYNPFENIRVGLNYLSELFNKYGNWDKALMCYNMGERRAKELWGEEIYSSCYSREIQERAQEIKQEIEQD